VVRRPQRTPPGVLPLGPLSPAFSGGLGRVQERTLPRVLARVAERRTVQAWLERATRRTVKHLREEVEAVESIARANGERQRGPEPPDEETMETFLELQRAMLDGRVAHAIANGRPCDDALRSQMSVDHKDQDQHGGQMSVGRQDEDAHPLRRETPCRLGLLARSRFAPWMRRVDDAERSSALPPRTVDDWNP